MMGDISKQENKGELRLERRMLGSRQLLTVKRDLCNGCGVCAELCPKGSVNIKPAVIENGRLVHFPIVDIDVNTCIMCGLCAVFCPLGALEAWVDNEKMAMFVKNDALPQLVKVIEVSQERCEPDCGLKCQENCPREAIKVIVNREPPKPKKFETAKIMNCIRCGKCLAICCHNLPSVLIKEAVDKGNWVKVKNLGVEYCDGCGYCSYVCPSRINLKGIMTSAKQKIEKA